MPLPWPSLIDSDVHNASDASEFLPYLSAYWREWVKTNGARPASGHYQSPVGVLRSDARSPGGGTPGSDPAHLIEHHLDHYGIDYAILTGSGILGISLVPDPDYGNAIASAYNDLLVEKWLNFSPRFKGSLLINHSDPEAAAQEIDRMGGHLRAADERWLADALHGVAQYFADELHGAHQQPRV